MTPVRAAVLGAGSWGTTFAAVLADAGCEVTLWGRDEKTCRQITDEHRNEAYLPGDLAARVDHRVDGRDRGPARRRPDRHRGPVAVRA